MLKRLTLSLSLAIALGTCSLGVAGGHGKALPTAQGPIASGQCDVLPSPQGCGEVACGGGCGGGFEMPDICGALKGCFGKLKCLKPKPACYTYEWVLKKKKVHSGLFGHKGGCETPACDSCGTYASPQAWPSGQGGASGQGGGATGQIGMLAPATEAPMTPPPAPGTASNGGLIYLPSGN
jgi:hypothetical protein